MTTYDYRAKDRAGNTVTGSVEADSERDAAARIREMGQYPLQIKASRGASTPPPSPSASEGVRGRSSTMERRTHDEAGSALARYIIFPLWTGVNIGALALFFRQLGTMLEAGMSIAEALGSQGTRMTGRLGRLVREMAGAVRDGRRFSDELARHPRVFSPLVISLVRAGEAGGLLESMVKRIASYLEYEIRVRRKISLALLYPCVIFVFIVVTPHIPALFLEGSRAFFSNLWGSLRIWLPWLVLGIVAAKLLGQFEIPRIVWDSVKIVPPVIGTCARKVAMCRFSRALALLYSAGMPLAEAVHASADACANAAIGRKVKFAIPGLRAGKSLSESLGRTGALMPVVMDMVVVGERTGNISDVLEKAAEYMEDEVDASITKIGIALFVLTLLAAGAVVLVMVVRFYSGYFTGIMNAGE